MKQQHKSLSQPKPFTAELPTGVSQRPAYHGNFPGDNKPAPAPEPAPAPAPAPQNDLAPNGAGSRYRDW